MTRSKEPLSVARKQVSTGSLEGHAGDIARHGIGLRAGIDDDPALRPQILAGVMKTALDLGCQAALDLIDPQFAARQRDEQINLGACRGPIEICDAAFGRRSNQILDDEAFPASARAGMPTPR